MPDSLDLAIALGAALESFKFSEHGFGNLSCDLVDPSLPIRYELTDHLAEAVLALLADA